MSTAALSPPSSTTTTTTTTTPTTISARHVLRFIPNLIGYFRVISTLISLTIMILTKSSSSNAAVQYHILAISLYMASFIADLVDGWAARAFQQSSQFGGMLDMITDRCSTLGLLYVLGTTTPTNSASIQLVCR